MAAVLIPTFITVVKKAKISADTAVAKNMNTALASAEASDGKNATFYDAVQDIMDAGYSLEKLTPTSEDALICWDQSIDRIVFIDSDGKVLFSDDKYEEKDELWAVAHNESQITAYTENYNLYLADNFPLNTINISRGLDVGDNTGITTINYTNTGAKKDVIIRTNGGNLTVNAPNDTIRHYGTANIIDIQAISVTSFFENGTTTFAKIKSGRLVLEPSAEVGGIHLSATENSSKKTTKDIIVAVRQNVALPTITRDEITASESETLVLTVQQLSNDKDVPTADNVHPIFVKDNGGNVELTEDSVTGLEALSTTTDTVQLTLDTTAKKAEKAATEVVEPVIDINTNYVARIGLECYDTIDEAISSVESGDIITLIKDCATAGSIEYNHTPSRDMTVNLNEKTLTLNGYVDIYDEGATISFLNGNIIGNGGVIYTNSNNFTLNLTNIHYAKAENKDGKALYLYGNGLRNNALNIKNCSFTGTTDYCIEIDGIGHNVVIEDTSFEWPSKYIYWNSNYSNDIPSTLTVKGNNTQTLTADSILFVSSYNQEAINGSIAYTLAQSKEIWSNVVTSKPIGYTEAENNITISSPEGLAWFAKQVNGGNNYAGKTVTLASDINLSGYDWMPIGYQNGTSSKTFNGIFDGASHTISNLAITVNSSKNNGVGLFGKTHVATIKNINVEGSINTSSIYVGGIVGHGYASLINCNFNGNITGFAQSGGIAGAGGFNMNGCNFSGNVNGNTWIGGLLGNYTETNGDKSFINCSVKGSVYALYPDEDNNIASGALFGARSSATSITTITNCTTNEATVIVGSKVITPTPEAGGTY